MPGRPAQRYYFDHNATTPVSAEVLAVYLPQLTETYGNASSIHYFGQQARWRLETARQQVARLMGADPKEIVFTSGGTEACNLAIFGTVRRHGGAPRHVITSSIEHPAVLHACSQLEKEGAAVTCLPVGSNGAVDPEDVRRSLRPETVLISVMHVNNEIGTIQPIGEIAGIAREAGVPFHSDGVQAAGKLPLTAEADLYSLSAHKFYAPKGIGALYVRKGCLIDPLFHGGHHERDRRPGTHNVPGAIAMGAAAEWVTGNVTAESARLAALRDRLEQGILDRVPDTGVNGTGPRAAGVSNLYFDGAGAEALLIALDLAGFAVSTGSACSSGAVEPSHVLLALGASNERARASLRFSLGRGNDAAQVDALIDAVAEAAAHVRRVAPKMARHG